MKSKTVKKRLDIEKEFIQLVNGNSQILFRVCQVFCKGSNYEVADLRQEILCALWKEYSRYATSRYKDCSHATWVFSIAWRVAMNYHRDHIESRKQEEIMPAVPDWIQPTVEQSDSRLDDLISRLNSNEQRWITYYLDRSPYESISRKENISEPSARKRMSRIIQKIKKMNSKKQ